ncbi:Oxoglutarate/iron-dependent dioxygenase, partial [uncultured virus]
VRYEPGQYYKPHHDSCCEDIAKCREFAKVGGQRKLTVLVYLNDAFEGGSTEFPNLGFTAKPPPGDAIVFYPLANNTNRCHPLALHGGMPVTSGEKWVANLWFRESKFKD